MIALPSIAFEGFSGSAKGVTARRVGGRNILSVKAWPTGPTTNAQVARRTSMSKISKSWKQLTNEQMRDWDRLAEHASSASVLGQKTEISGMNLYIRLNVKVDRFLPNGALQRAAQAVKDKQCRFCEIKKTVTAVERRHTTQLTVEQFNKMLPIEVANQFFIDKTGNPMTEQQQEMFNYVYQAVQKENRQ